MHRTHSVVLIQEIMQVMLLVVHQNQKQRLRLIRVVSTVTLHFILKMIQLSAKPLLTMLTLLYYFYQSLSTKQLIYVLLFLQLFSTMVPCKNPFPTIFCLLRRTFYSQKKINVHHCCGCCTKLLENNQHCKSVVCKMSGIPNSSFIEI